MHVTCGTIYICAQIKLNSEGLPTRYIKLTPWILLCMKLYIKYLLKIRNTTTFSQLSPLPMEGELSSRVEFNGLKANSDAVPNLKNILSKVSVWRLGFSKRFQRSENTRRFYSLFCFNTALYILNGWQTTTLGKDLSQAKYFYDSSRKFEYFRTKRTVMQQYVLQSKWLFYQHANKISIKV